MTNKYIARGLVTAKGSKIESLLRKLGAGGIGLKELRSSISDKLPLELQNQIRRVHFLRNEASHEEVFQISEMDLREFAAVADDVIFQLELMIADEDTSGNFSTELPKFSEEKPGVISGATIIEKAKKKALENEPISPSPLSDGDREILRKRALAETENRRLAMQMDTKTAGKAKSGISPKIKADLKKAAIHVGISLVVGTLFRR